MPDEELKQLLKKNLEVSEESLRILKKMNRVRIFGNIYTFLKWVIIVGVSVGLYYYLDPYIKKLTDDFKKLTDALEIVSSGANQIKSISPNLLENLKNLLP